MFIINKDMKLVVLTTILVLVQSKPNGVYHEQYNYKTSSSSFRNNELQHQKDDEGYYAKHGDLDGRIQPKVNAREQHSEYINPRLKSLGYTSDNTGSTYGQMQTGQQHYEDVFQNGMYNQYQPSHGGGNVHSNYGVQSNLRQLSTQVQQQLAQQLNEAIMNQYRRTTAYSNSLTQSQIDADRRLLEDELRRNVSLNLQDAIRLRYGTQAVRSGLSYTLANGRLQPTANYNSQELDDLTQQLENDLMRQLNEGVRTYYHTSSSSSSHHVTSVKGHQTNNNYNYPYTDHIQTLPRQPLPSIQPQPLPLPHQLPIHLEPTRIDYGPVISNPDSLTTIATRVQHDLNEHLNKILDDTRNRYFSTQQSAYQIQNFDHILQQLKDDLHYNVTHQFDLQLHQQPQRFKIEDLDNYKRQIENNLITRLIRDFNTQRDYYLRTHTSNSNSNSGINSNIYQTQPTYYPNVNNYVGRINQDDELTNLQRQLHDDLSRQLQVALIQQRYQRFPDSTVGNFNYNTLLQQLTDELNRNLTQQIQQRLRQHYGGNVLSGGQQYEQQTAQLRNMLENDLQRQLQQGLQQYSQHYSWSSSSSASSAASASNIKNYRPVRGFESYSIPLGNPDCMMGDDPSTYQQQQQQEDDLTQQLEDQDLTQQLEDLDLNQKQSDLTQQLENVDVDNNKKLQQLSEKPPKTQRLEDFNNDDDDDDQQQQQEEILPQSPGSYNSHHHRHPHHDHHHHHHHHHNHQHENRPAIRFLKKYYITDSDGIRKQVDETQFYKNLEISKHISQDSKGNLKFFIADNFGHNVEIKPEQQTFIEQLFHKWFQDLTSLNTNQQVRKTFYIEDANGQRSLLTENEFQQYLKNFRAGNLHMTYKFYQTDNNGINTEINPYTLNLIGQSQVSSKYYVIDSDGKRREVNATEYQRLSKKPQSTVSSILNQRYYRIDSQGNRQEIKPDQFTTNNQQQTEHTDEDLQALEPGFHRKPPSQIQQIVDDFDLTQQVQEPSFGTSQSQITQHNQNQINRSVITQQHVQQTGYRKPHTTQSQLEFGQQIDDSDLTQQVQQPDFGKPHSDNLQQQLEVGQQIDDADLTQQVQQSDFAKPGKLQQSQLEFGQSIDDSDLTQQIQQPNFGNPHSLEIGSDLTQQVQQPDFSKPKPGKPRPEFGQQIDDSDLTQQIQQPNFGKPHSDNLQQPQLEFGQQIDDSDLTQQIQQPDFTKPHSGKLQRPEFGQEIDESDLTQQVQQPDFGKPHSGNLQQPQLEFGQQVDDSDLPQQVQQPDFSKPHSTKPRLEFGQQIDDSDLTQQVQQPDFTKPHSGKLQRPEFGQEIDESHLTQQVQQPDFGKPHSDNHQRPQLEFGQQIDDSDLTQQVQQPDFSKPHSRKPRPEFGQQIDDSDLTQQVQQPDFTKPHSGNLQQPQLEFGQQVDDSDLTQQVQQPDFSKPGKLQQQQTEFGQQAEDLELTQQIQQQPDFTKPYSGKLQQSQLEFGQQVDESDLTQQTQQPVFNKPQLFQKPIYGNLEIGSQHRQEIQSTGKLQNQLEFGQEIDDSDVTQHVQQPTFVRPHSLQHQQHTNDLDLTQQIQESSHRTRKPSYGNLEIGSYQQQQQQIHSTGKLQQQLEFGQQIDESDLTQQIQQHKNDNLEATQQIEDIDYDQSQQIQKQTNQQSIEQPIEPQIANQQIFDQTNNKHLTDAEQTSQQLIDALQKHIETKPIRPMTYRPRPVYTTLDIGGDNYRVPVGTTRHISQNNYYTDNQHDSSYGGYRHSYHNTDFSQDPPSIYSSHVHNQKQTGETEITASDLTNTARVGLKTRITNQNHLQQQQETTTEEIITTTEQPGFWKRLGSKVRNKAQSITSIF